VANDDDITTEVGSEFHSIMVERKKLWRYALKVLLDWGSGMRMPHCPDQ